MEIIKTDDFNRAFQKLPKEIQRLYTVQESRLRDNWRDPRLHMKKMRIFLSAFSFRITRRYRAFFYFKNNVIAVFFDIDHRKDIFR